VTESAVRKRARLELCCLWGLFFSSGVAALIYQVMWTRSFGLIFGNTSRAAAAVLASFFLGMTIGNWLGGRFARDRRTALGLYALAELAIAAGGLLVLVWLALYRDQYPGLYGAEWFAGGTATALQLILALVAMAPPCIAMGATLPLIARVSVYDSHLLGRRLSSIYAFNTAGAVVGVLLAGFFLPVKLGTQASVWLAAGINVAVALGAAGMWRSWHFHSAAPAGTDERAGAAEEDRAFSLDGALLFIAGASGFGTLAMEVMFTRLLVTWTDNSVYSFAVVLACFLTSLALASAGVSAVVDRMRSPWTLLAASSSLVAVALLLAPSVFGELLRLRSFAQPGNTWENLLRLGVNATATIAPAALAAGVALPVAWKIAAKRAEESGRAVGVLTSVNTLAAVLGSVIGGFVLIPMAGLSLSFVFVAALYAGMAAVAWRRSAQQLQGGPGVWIAVAATMLALVLCWSFESWRVLPINLKDGERVVDYRDGESAAVAVTRNHDGVLQLRVNNRYSLGNTSPRSTRTQRIQGRFGLGALGDPESVAFIGVATGISVSVVSEFPSLDRVLAIELIPGVLNSVGAFEKFNRGVLHDPRVEVVAADGRNHIYGSQERYDVIVGDLFVPWHAGTGYLYTREHFETVESRLTERGIFVQWLAGNQISLPELRLVAASFRDALAEMEIYQIIDTPVIGLVGRSHSGGISSKSSSSGFTSNHVRRACSPKAIAKWVASSRRNTDDFPLVEFLAAARHISRSAQRPTRVAAFLEKRCSR
jgi:spermidine synthase